MTKTNIKIAPSSVINYGGLDCIVLDVEQDKILVLAKESIGNMPFDEGNSNNFPKGTLCKYLNGEFIKKLKANGADTSALIPTTIDLTSDDGLKDYGETTQKIFLRAIVLHLLFLSLSVSPKVKNQPQNLQLLCHLQKFFLPFSSSSFLSSFSDKKCNGFRAKFTRLWAADS